MFLSSSLRKTILKANIFDKTISATDPTNRIIFLINFEFLTTYKVNNFYGWWCFIYNNHVSLLPQMNKTCLGQWISVAGTLGFQRTGFPCYSLWLHSNILWMWIPKPQYQVQFYYISKAQLRFHWILMWIIKTMNNITLNNEGHLFLKLIYSARIIRNVHQWRYILFCRGKITRKVTMYTPLKRKYL